MRPFDGYFILLMMWNGIPIVQYWIERECHPLVLLHKSPYSFSSLSAAYSDKEEELTGK